jgi:hypothetical protein
MACVPPAGRPDILRIKNGGSGSDPDDFRRPVMAQTMTTRRWIVVGAAGVATVAVLAAVAPGVAKDVAAAVEPVPTAYLAAGYGQGGQGARQAGVAGHGYGGRADDVAAVAPGPAEAATGECDACTAEPGSGDVAALGTSGVADLLRWVEEEKLAHDLYLALADQYAGTVTAGRFERIAASETQHRTAVQTLLATYGLDDPSAGAASGEFTDPELQALYDTLLAQGSTSVDEALAVGRAVESDDIDLLERTAAQVQADDVATVLTQQLAASRHHLAAFGG